MKKSHKKSSNDSKYYSEEDEKKDFESIKKPYLSEAKVAELKAKMEQEYRDRNNSNN